MTPETLDWAAPSPAHSRESGNPGTPRKPRAEESLGPRFRGDERKRRCGAETLNASIRGLNRGQRHVDALELRIVLDRCFAVLAAEAGTLCPAEGQLDRRHVVVVDPAGAGFE